MTITGVFRVTEKVFWSDPYLSELKTRVRTINGNQVTLYETIFYAFSGGQESDYGTINNIPVLEAKKNGHDIIYTLEADHGLHENDEVFIQIDWQRRYRLMRLHFAAEVILETVYKLHPGIKKIGAHIAQDKARIDFAWPQNISTIFPQLQKQIEQLVTEGKKVISDFSDISTQKRYWEVENFARVPCGGTHLRATSEIGQIALKRKNIGGNKERIEITLYD
jgi:alanyl-tRNA synthetase